MNEKDLDNLNDTNNSDENNKRNNNDKSTTWGHLPMDEIFETWTDEDMDELENILENL